MCRSEMALVLLIALTGAGTTLGQQVPKSQAKPVRIATPGTSARPKVDAKLLQRGTSVARHATISKTGEVTNLKFVKGNADLMPEVRRVLKTWKYKPYLYQGHPVQVDTTIFVNFDPLVGD